MPWPDTVTPEEDKVIAELKKRLSGEMSPKLLEDETVFYRFCKARDFKIDDAESMLRKHIAWRKEYGVDTILTDYTPLEVFKYSGSSFVCFDKEDCLIRYADISHIDVKGIFNAIRKIDFIRYCIFMAEGDMQLMREHSIKIGKPVTQIVLIYNFGDFSLAQATHKKTLESCILFTKMFQENYPERVKTLYHINASIYYTGLMAILKTVMATPLLEKLRCFGTEGWKEDLLKTNDAKVLPAFLGGKRTDPDGNPLCKTFINHPEKIPEEYFLINIEKKLSKDPAAKKVTVAGRSKEEITFEVDQLGSYLEWEFEMKNWEHDINFAVYFKEESTDKFKPVELVSKKKIDTCFSPEKSTLKCKIQGLYTIVFDNSYSWMTPKEIYYKSRLRGPNDDDNVKCT
ncbi:SEC14-like protein 2 [Caerostris darwini]|uniref:SEC14-like protein 2 n=1 Tax=Caerostris darwini TaxID=1538125 RepID=A0AAV4X461_9ARAC|nr:SEC14-like protein 2 [Caerostris darwini]